MWRKQHFLRIKDNNRTGNMQVKHQWNHWQQHDRSTSVPDKGKVFSWCSACFLWEISVCLHFHFLILWIILSKISSLSLFLFFYSDFGGICLKTHLRRWGRNKGRSQRGNCLNSAARWFRGNICFYFFWVKVFI